MGWQISSLLMKFIPLMVYSSQFGGHGHAQDEIPGKRGETNTNSMCFQPKQGSNRMCSAPESHSVQSRFPMSGTSYLQQVLWEQPSCWEQLKIFSNKIRDNCTSTFRWFMNKEQKKKKCNVLLRTDYYSTLFKNTKGCFDRSKSTSRSHCPLYLAKSPQLTRATWTTYCCEAAVATETSADTPSDKKHHKISTFTLVPLVTTNSKPSLQLQLHNDQLMPSQDQPQASRLRISLVTSWGRRHDAHLISLPNFVWILIPHTFKDLQGGFSLHWFYLCCRKEHFLPLFSISFQCFEMPQLFKMLMQRMKATET